MWTCASPTVRLALGVMTTPLLYANNRLQEFWTTTNVVGCSVVGTHLRVGDVLVPQPQFDGDKKVVSLGHDTREGTAAFKMLPWFEYALTAFPDAFAIMRTASDVLLATSHLWVPQVESYFGIMFPTSYWSPKRKIHMYSHGPIDEGPFPFAYGSLLGPHRNLASSLADCAFAKTYMQDFTSGGFREDDGLFGYLVFKCIGKVATHHVNTTYAHNMDCRKSVGYNHMPSNTSVVVHNVKSDASMCFAKCSRGRSINVHC